ncbi:hypothetical protein AGMMS49992_22240 [Clostridia bacterium]|nr:hypothetical protein AGMMS49992_22240 [Clostridia bacterium]
MKTFDEILKCGRLFGVTRGVDGFSGYCQLPAQNKTLAIIVSNGGSWDHVSPLANRG